MDGKDVEYEYAIGLVHVASREAPKRYFGVKDRDDGEELVIELNRELTNFTGAVLYQRKGVGGPWEEVKEESRAESGVEEKVEESQISVAVTGGCEKGYPFN